MAIKIQFDAANNPESPTIVLAKRNGDKLGVLDAKEIEVLDALNDASEISFKVYKYVDEVKCNIWDEITDFKLVYCVEWNEWFEITVDIDEATESVKTVFGTSLAHAELGQIMLYDIEINTEDDIARDDYVEPTILFNETNPKASLLHRIMEKAPHYKIAHVDSTIAKIQRTFSFDGDSIYDALQDIAEEINCIFIFNTASEEDDTLQRNISAYDLESTCLDCRYRGEFTEVCPKCGSDNIYEGYGNDTSIFVTSDELADSISFTTDTDSVKNCFKLEAGDDLMTATVRNCNPNGSDYIWRISDDTKADMSKELVDKIDSYDKDYDYYQNEYVVMAIENDALSKYNSLVDKYQRYNEDLERISVPIKGYPSLMNAYYNTIDFKLYLTSSMMPSVETMETDAKKEAAKLTTANVSPVATQSISVISNTTADNAVLMMAKLVVDSRFKVKVKSSSIVKGSNLCTWTGSFEVTNYYDDEDTAVSDTINVVINDDYVSFVKQKIEKELSKDDDTEVDIVGLFDKDYDDFVEELRKYSLNRLTSFHDACQACIDILIEQGIADRKTWSGQDPNLYDDLYYPYLKKLNAISSEMDLRQQEINIISGVYDSDGDLKTYGLQNYLEEYRDNIQSKLDFQKYIGDELWIEFCSFKREDKYSNDNYISDGLDNKELFERAREFIDAANEEIFKSSERQHSISTDLKNLLVIDKFSPLVNEFEVGNWLRVMVDDTVYKLRLIQYSIEYDDIGSISVEFSDVIKSRTSVSDIQSVLEQASTMATSYGAVTRQAEQGKNGNDKLNGWVNEGLYLTNMKIVNSADNQNISWDSHGVLCKEYLPITDTYDDRQLKIINRGLYVTDDNWETSRAGIGNFVFYNPKTKRNEEAYGVIADTIVGNIILSEEVGIYNRNNSITMDENGFVITTNADGSTPESIFAIQKEHKDEDGDSTIEKLLYVDADGNLSLNGGVNVVNSKNESITIDAITDPDRVTVENNTAMQSFQLSLEGLTSEFSKTNETISDIGIEMSSMSSRIEQNAEAITTEANARTEAIDGAITTANSYTDQKADEIKLGVSEEITSSLENYYTKSEIDIVPDGIKTFVGDNYVNNTTFEQTKESFTFSINNAQSTADSAKSAASSAQSTANSAQSTASSALSTANSASSQASTAYQEALDAARTATDYLKYSSSGLQVGYSSTGQNVLIGSSNVSIRSNSTILAQYSSSSIDLGVNSSSSVINMAKKSIIIRGSSNGTAGSFKNSAGAGFGFGSGGFDDAGGDSSCYITAPALNISCEYGGHASDLGKQYDDILLAACVLYDNDSGTSGTVTLQANYSGSTAGNGYIQNNIVAIDIYYRDNGMTKKHGVQRVYHPWGKTTTLQTIAYSSGNLYIETAMVTINGYVTYGTITFDSGKSGSATFTSNGNAVSSASGNNIYIMKVVGWR